MIRASQETATALSAYTEAKSRANDGYYVGKTGLGTLGTSTDTNRRDQ
jgi:hypothetical protein